MNRFEVSFGEYELQKNSNHTKLTNIVGIESLYENNFTINFTLPPVSIKGNETTEYSVPSSPHVFHCDKVILYDENFVR